MILTADFKIKINVIVIPKRTKVVAEGPITTDFKFAGGHGIVHTSAINTIKQLKGMIKG